MKQELGSKSTYKSFIGNVKMLLGRLVSWLESELDFDTC